MLYKQFSSLDSPVDLSSTSIDASNANQNSLVIDFNASLSIIVNLPSISSLLYSSNASTGAGSMSFFIKGNIVQGANDVTLSPALGDSICGSSSQVMSGVGACFYLFICGLNQWGLFSCGLGGSSSCYTMGETQDFVILTSGALTVNTLPNQFITTGDVGEGSLTGSLTFGTGSNFNGLTPATQSVIDALALYNALVLAGTGGIVLGGGAVNLGTINQSDPLGNYDAGKFHPNIYQAGGAFNTDANGIITLDGAGCYVFYADGAFTTGANTTFVLINGAVASQVFFVTTGAFTTGANSIVKGNFVTSSAGATLGANTELEGRVLSNIGAITITNGANIIQLPIA